MESIGLTALQSPTSNRVRKNTAEDINQHLDEAAYYRVQKYHSATVDEINTRLAELEREWDTEKTLELSFASLVLISTYLGLTTSKKWFSLGGIAAGFMVMHALQGWCPPLPLIRRLGIRTPAEIDQEKNALRELKGI